MTNGIADRRHGTPSRREFEELEETVNELKGEIKKMNELLQVNTDLTSDIRAILRSSKLMVVFIKGVGVIAAGVAAMIAVYQTARHALGG